MATVNLILRKRKLANNEYPIVIRLSKKGCTTIYLRIDGLSCNESEWNKELSRFKRNKQDYKELNKTLLDIENKIDSITSKLLSQDKFTFNRFKDLYYDKQIDNSVFNAFDLRINELTQLNKIGTANFYSSCKVALEDYCKNKHLTFDDIDYKFLLGYKNKRLLEGNCLNSIAVYFRGLRAMHYGYCKQNQLMRPTAYIEIGIKTETTKKKALTKDQLQKLINYKCLTDVQQRSVDIFMFSFYCRGINVTDIAQLTKGSIINGRVEYQRSKTNGRFSILITSEMQTILDRYTNETGNYLFPILSNDTNDVKKTIKTFNGNLNRSLRKIANSIKIPEFSFYAARHSYASILRVNNVNIDLISQSLGHSNTKITEVYLNSFPDSKLDEVSANLL